MKRAKILSSKAAFNSILTVVITQINPRQTFGDGAGQKHYFKLKHHELLTSGHFLPLRNHSRPFPAYHFSEGTAECDTEPSNACSNKECKTWRAIFTCRHVLTSVCTRGGGQSLEREKKRERHRGTKRDRSVFAQSGLCSPVLGSTLPDSRSLQSWFPLSILLLNWNKWKRWIG